MLRILMSFTLVISALLVAGCMNNEKSMNIINVVATSLDGKYKATIKGSSSTKELLVVIEGIEEGNELLNSEITIPGGYHDPIITMSWDKPETLTITIDHDLGESNLIYTYRVGTSELELL